MSSARRLAGRSRSISPCGGRRRADLPRLGGLVRDRAAVGHGAGTGPPDRRSLDRRSWRRDWLTGARPALGSVGQPSGAALRPPRVPARREGPWRAWRRGSRRALPGGVRDGGPLSRADRPAAGRRCPRFRAPLLHRRRRGRDGRAVGGVMGGGEGLAAGGIVGLVLGLLIFGLVMGVLWLLSSSMVVIMARDALGGRQPGSLLRPSRPSLADYWAFRPRRVPLLGTLIVKLGLLLFILFPACWRYAAPDVHLAGDFSSTVTAPVRRSAQERHHRAAPRRAPRYGSWSAWYLIFIAGRGSRLLDRKPRPGPFSRLQSFMLHGAPAEAILAVVTVSPLQGTSRRPLDGPKDPVRE